PAGLALLRPERRPEGVHLAQGHRAGLRIELAGLGEEGAVLLEQLDLEEVGRALHRGRHEERRVEAHEAALTEEVVYSALDLVARPHARPRSAMAQVQVAVLEEEVATVLLGRDGVLVARTDQLHFLDAELDTARRPLVDPHLAGYLDARLLGELLGCL